MKKEKIINLVKKAKIILLLIFEILVFCPLCIFLFYATYPFPIIYLVILFSLNLYFLKKYKFKEILKYINTNILEFLILFVFGFLLFKSFFISNLSMTKTIMILVNTVIVLSSFFFLKYKKNIFLHYFYIMFSAFIFLLMEIWFLLTLSISFYGFFIGILPFISIIVFFLIVVEYFLDKEPNERKFLLDLLVVFSTIIAIYVLYKGTYYLGIFPGVTSDRQREFTYKITGKEFTYDNIYNYYSPRGIGGGADGYQISVNKIDDEFLLEDIVNENFPKEKYDYKVKKWGETPINENDKFSIDIINNTFEKDLKSKKWFDNMNLLLLEEGNYFSYELDGIGSFSNIDLYLIDTKKRIFYIIGIDR